MLLFLKIVAGVILAIMVLVVVISVVAGRRADRKVKSLNVEGREPVPFDQFFHQYFEGPENPPMDKEIVRRALQYVAELSTLPADRLRPEDDLDQIAAAGGLKRAMLVASLMTHFQEAEVVLTRMMMAGETINLWQTLATVALGTAQTRAQAASSAQAQQDPPQEKV